MMAATFEPHTELTAKLCDALRPATAEIIKSHTIPWASATFSGLRHFIEVAVTGEAASKCAQILAAELRELEFDLAKHIVADVTVTKMRDTPLVIIISVEALTVEIF